MFSIFNVSFRRMDPTISLVWRASWWQKSSRLAELDRHRKRWRSMFFVSREEVARPDPSFPLSRIFVYATVHCFIAMDARTECFRKRNH
jgi:hypothetical protein